MSRATGLALGVIGLLCIGILSGSPWALVAILAIDVGLAVGCLYSILVRDYRRARASVEWHERAVEAQADRMTGPAGMPVSPEPPLLPLYQCAFPLAELEAERQRILQEQLAEMPAGLFRPETLRRLWLGNERLLGEQPELLLPNPGRPLARPQPTPEERAAAEAKAAQLLKDVLSEVEQEQVRRFGFLDVPSPGHPGRSYRIPRKVGGFVWCWERGEQRMRLCVQASVPVPADDFIVMQKLQIEGNEEEWLRTANRV